MIRRLTARGTPVLELSTEEYARFLDDESRRRVGLSGAEFEGRYLAGELDRSDPDVELLVALLAIGQT